MLNVSNNLHFQNSEGKMYKYARIPAKQHIQILIIKN